MTHYAGIIRCVLGGSHSSKYLHEFHLSAEEMVHGAFCGKDFVKLVPLKMYYPPHMPSDASNSPPPVDGDIQPPPEDKPTEP